MKGCHAMSAKHVKTFGMTKGVVDDEFTRPKNHEKNNDRQIKYENRRLTIFWAIWSRSTLAKDSVSCWICLFH